jgi:hypothetical protein
LWLVLLGTVMAAEAPVEQVLPSGIQAAQRLIAEGSLAMSEANTDPDRIVDAAIAFTEALKFYEKSGDIDRICDLEANIYWCKKRMNQDNVQRFLARKVGGKEAEKAQTALAKAEVVVNKKVPQEEAKNYFARAEKFAQENPDHYLAIAIRYCEVAERFQTTEFGPRAMRLSLEAQDRYAKARQEAQEAQRGTIFSKTTKPPSAAKLAAVPSAVDQKNAIATLRKIYQDDYAKRKLNQKKNQRALVAKLMDQAQQTRDDPVLFHGLLCEAGDMALEIGEYQTVIAAIDLKAASFAEIDALAQKKAIFGKARGNPTVKAILILLDAPADAEANTTAGRYFCCEAKQWDIGLPMLARGSDADLKQVANMELLGPSGAMQQCEIGDRWFDLGMKAKTPLKEQLLKRCFFWYRQARPGLTGVSKDKVTHRLDEILDLRPIIGSYKLEVTWPSMNQSWEGEVTIEKKDGSGFHGQLILRQKGVEYKFVVLQEVLVTVDKDAMIIQGEKVKVLESPEDHGEYTRDIFKMKREEEIWRGFTVDDPHQETAGTGKATVSRNEDD